MEEWKDIKGYEGLYQVSNMGNVKSLNYRHTGKEKILKAGEDIYGYLFVNLCKEGISKTYKVHRLVATAFCENPQGLPEVNHISEDKTDCRAENLEWCSSKYNCNYGTRNRRVSEKLRGRKHSEEHTRKVAEKLRGRKQSEEHIKKRAEKLIKPIYGINKVSGLIVELPSVMEAERTLGIAHQSITSCCKGKRKSAGGFYWMYSD